MNSLVRVWIVIFIVLFIVNITKSDKIERFSSKSRPNLKKFASPKLAEVTLTINKKEFKVRGDTSPDTRLSTFIRSHAHLSGTKTMCEEGGCGSCVVAVRRVHPVTGQDVVYAVNSCLVPVLGCHGWDVMTVEGIGSQHNGYHPLQVLLAAHNGSQCGYCSPGMVVNMYSLMENQHQLTQEEIEQSFDGNICRCTGYRPILEAFKSVASDSASGKNLKCQDIEDMLKDCINGCKYTVRCDSKNICKNGCLHKNQFEESVNGECRPHSESVLVNTCEGKWHKVTTKEEIFEVLKSIDKETYRFVAGNTAHGVYRDDKEYQNFIDISDVSELKSYDVSDSKLMVGVNMTLTELVLVLHHVADSNSNLYHYAAALSDHVSLIANVPIRNAGTLAGNLCIKKEHPAFPSDLFLCLETVGAQIIFEKDDGKTHSVSLVEFLSVDLDKALLMYVVLPPLDQSLYVVRTFKIMPRAKNVHAYVNAGFRFKVDKEAKFKVLEKPSVVFGGISSSFVHASETEQLLESLGSQGKGLLEEEVLRAALESLRKEIHPEPLSPEVDPQYRVGLAIALFYKTMLGLSAEAVAPQYHSGATCLTRPVSSSKRDFDTDKSAWPVNKPVPKVEALYQCSGEAQYLADIPEFPGELHGALVLTNVAKGTVSFVDASQALSMPGVVAFYTSKDIPGVNSFTTGFGDDEPVLCDGKVLYHGQPLGIVVANTRKIAIKAASKVVVKYFDVGTPVLKVKRVIESNDKSRVILQAEMTPTVSTDVSTELQGETVTVSGSVDLHEQYHMTMELQQCLCVPIEDGMDVYSSTQWMEHVHNAVSRVLSMPAHRINMKVRRLGGGYGAKLTRSTWVAALCAVAAKLSNTSVRLVLPLEINMAMMGKRYGCLTNYKVEVDKATGKILHLEGNFYEDAGWSENDPVVEGTMAMLPSAYDPSSWSFKGYIVKTDKASNTWCRSPGSTEAIGTIEVIMDTIAAAIGLDPITVRLANMASSETNPVPSMVEYWRKHTDYEARLEEIKKYNSENTWKKRGISLVPMTYKLFLASRYNAMVTIFAVDGTVAISHGGIECGQGINTKVVQVCAYGLGIDMSLIQVKPTDILISPNNEGTGGSVSSESVCYAVMECCKKLQERLEPVRKLLPSGYTWQELIQKAYSEQVKLSATYLFTSKDGVKDYDIFGVTVAEVEVDILTGQHQVRRVDILEDAGVSLSPEIDIGQVEGAFVMGLGYYTLESLVYDERGALLTNRTWNYYPPGPLDIPIDFRIELRKNAPNPLGVLRSKATGEPPLCMSVAVPLAMCHAIQETAARAGAPPFVQAFNPPMSPEKMFLACKNDISFYKYT